MWQSVEIFQYVQSIERFQYFNFETDFLQNENHFQKNWSTLFNLKALRMKMHHFHIKLPYQKPLDVTRKLVFIEYKKVPANVKFQQCNTV